MNYQQIKACCFCGSGEWDELIQQGGAGNYIDELLQNPQRKYKMFILSDFL